MSVCGAPEIPTFGTLRRLGIPRMRMPIRCKDQQDRTNTGRVANGHGGLYTPVGARAN